MPATTPSADRLGASFRLLMHARLLIMALSVFLLAGEDFTPNTMLLLVGLAFLYWLAARSWRRIVPQMLAHPMLTGIDIFVSFAVLSATGPLGPFFLSTVAASAIAGLLFRWRGMVTVSLAQIVCYFGALMYFLTWQGPSAGELGNFQTLFGQPAYYPIVGLVGVMLRKLFDEYEEAEAARHAAEMRSAAADERTRLAREMHDSLAKTLRGIAMSAQALPVWVRKSPERAATEAQRIASAAEVASREARELLGELRDDQVREPLTHTIRQVVQRWAAENTDVDVTARLTEGIDLPLMVRYELVAILKETLTNIGRHAGAESVIVALHADADRITMSVQDDGDGFPTRCDGPDWLDELASAGHYGVVGMYERAKRAGAELAVTSTPEDGTTVTVTVDRSAEQASPSTDERQPAEAG